MIRILFCISLILYVNEGLLCQNFKNIQFLDNWSEDSIITNSTLARYNDCWGITVKQKEYAIFGSTEGTHVFEISNKQLIFRDFKKGTYSASNVVHRDFKNYKNFLYAVCDEGTSALQIFDCNSLPDSLTLLNEINSGFGRIHNIYIDTANATLYANIVRDYQNSISYSMRIYSLSDPLNPTILYNGPIDIPEVHDCYVRDNLAYLNCGFNGLRIYDVSNPSNPILKQDIEIYNDQGYNHQGFLSPDGKTYIFGDETNGKQLKKGKVENGLFYFESSFGTNYQNGSVPHNIWLSDQFAYVAYYNEGLRIFDYKNFNTPIEVAYYDTYEVDHPYKLNGAWGVFQDFKDGKLLVSDRQNGLFLFQFNEKEFETSTNDNDVSIFPNPINNNSVLKIRIHEILVDEISVEITDNQGKKIAIFTNSNFNYIEFNPQLEIGAYHLRIRYTVGDETFEEMKKLVVY